MGLGVPRAAWGASRQWRSGARLQHRPRPSLVDLTFKLPILCAWASSDDGDTSCSPGAGGVGGHAEVTVGGANITKLGPGAHCAREAIWGTLGPQLGLRGPSADSSYGANTTCFCCLTLCDQMHRSPPGSSVHGVFRARLLQWVSTLPPRDLPDPRIAPASASSALQADSSLLSHRRREEHVPPAPNCSGLNGVSQRFLHVLTPGT